jgi:hypothetical protein
MMQYLDSHDNTYMIITKKMNHLTNNFKNIKKIMHHNYDILLTKTINISDD